MALVIGSHRDRNGHRRQVRKISEIPAISEVNRVGLELVGAALCGSLKGLPAMDVDDSNSSGWSEIGFGWIRKMFVRFSPSSSEGGPVWSCMEDGVEEISMLLITHVSGRMDSGLASVEEKQTWLRLKPMVEELVSMLAAVPENLRERLISSMYDMFKKLRECHEEGDCSRCLEVVSDIVSDYPASLKQSFVKTFGPLFKESDVHMKYLTPVDTDVEPIEMIEQCREYLLNRLYLIENLCMDLQKNQCQVIHNSINELLDSKIRAAQPHFDDARKNHRAYDPTECAKLLLLQHESIRIGQRIQDLFRQLYLKFHQLSPEQYSDFVRSDLNQTLHTITEAVRALSRIVQDDDQCKTDSAMTPATPLSVSN